MNVIMKDLTPSLHNKKLLLTLGVLVVLGSVLIWQRHFVLFKVMGGGESPPLSEKAAESENSRWYGDYFLVEDIDASTFAIGEPRYYQQNFSYLIAGSERAILFDAGPGYRDIRAVAESLTDLPITFIPSHFHYDHTGNEITFDRVAVVDLPRLRKRAPDNKLKLTWHEHLGSLEGVDIPTLNVDEWLPIGSEIDLGDRTLRVLYTPGHTDDSISLMDTGSGAVFVGDFIYPGPLYAFLPNSSLGDYLDGSRNLLHDANLNSPLFTAHRDEPPGIPKLSTSDVEDLQEALIAIKDGSLTGEGIYPHVYEVNDRIELYAEPPWLQDWGD